MLATVSEGLYTTVDMGQSLAAWREVSTATPHLSHFGDSMICHCHSSFPVFSRSWANIHMVNEYLGGPLKPHRAFHLNCPGSKLAFTKLAYVDLVLNWPFVEKIQWGVVLECQSMLFSSVWYPCWIAFHIIELLPVCRRIFLPSPTSYLSCKTCRHGRSLCVKNRQANLARRASLQPCNFRSPSPPADLGRQIWSQLITCMDLFSSVSPQKKFRLIRSIC